MRNRKNILIVDDDALIIDFLAFILNLNGYTVHKASGAYEAMRIMVENNIDLCLSDIHMPRVDGYQLCAKVRALYRDSKVILMTGDHCDLAVRKARMSGANECISKSISPEMLVAKIKVMLEVPEEASVA